MIDAFMDATVEPSNPVVRGTTNDARTGGFARFWAWLGRQAWLRRRILVPLRLGDAAFIVDIAARLNGRPLAAADVVVLHADNGGTRSRKFARIEDAPPRIAAAMAQWQVRSIDPPAAVVAIIDRAVISAGIVRLADGSAIQESLVNTGRPDPSFPYVRDAAGDLRRRRPSVRIGRRCAGPPHVLLKQYWDANYGHWLVEGLPRLAVVEDHFKLDDLKFIVAAHHGPMQAVYRDSLAFFGIGPERIVEIGTENVAVDTLIYPTPITRHPWQIAPRCIEVLERMAARVTIDPFGSDRLYVSRAMAGKCHLLNEAAILDIVRKRGFTVVCPEGMTLCQQIALFRQARIVVGNYGAALTNVAFAAGDVTLFALTSAFMQDDFFSTLMSLRRGRYVSLHGTAQDPGLGQDADFSIDPRRFQAMLDDIL